MFIMLEQIVGIYFDEKLVFSATFAKNLCSLHIWFCSRLYVSHLKKADLKYELSSHYMNNTFVIFAIFFWFEIHGHTFHFILIFFFDCFSAVRIFPLARRSESVSCIWTQVEFYSIHNLMNEFTGRIVSVILIQIASIHTTLIPPDGLSHYDPILL